ncbi:type IV secretion system protein [Azohydromonas aeria]|uniref:type IV secretion system protein n=1 Tax=Azohydromonas aeria TaxID=2590212 RepID=UPI0012FA1C93|nr:type IV secretion system protein [Azohydromonas aeria]
MGLIAVVGSEVDGALKTFVADNITILMGWLTPMAITAGTLWVFLYGLAVHRGEVQEPIQTFAWKLVRNMLIVALATTAAYNNYAARTFDNASLGLIQLFQISGSGMASITNAWDALDAFDREAGLLVSRVWEEISFGKDMVGGVIAIFFFALGNALFILCAFVVVLVTTLLGKFLLIVGPLFIMLALFESTRRFTINWVGSLFSIVLVTAVAFFCLGFSLYLNTRIVGAASANVGALNLIGEAAVYFAIFVGLGVVMWQSPGFVTGLTGGAPAQMGVAMFTQVMTMLRAGGRGSSGPKPPTDNSIGKGPSAAYRAGSAVGRATGIQPLYQRIASRSRG